MDLSRATWRKSSRSNSGGNCVEVAAGPGWSAVRDSKDPQGPALVLTPVQFRAFTDSIKDGRFHS